MTGSDKKTFKIKPEIWITSKHNVGSGTWNGLEGVAKNLSKRLGIPARLSGRDDMADASERLVEQLHDRMRALFGGGAYMLNDTLPISASDGRDISIFQSWEELGIPSIVITDESVYGADETKDIGLESMFHGKAVPTSTYVSSPIVFLRLHKYDIAKNWIVPHNLDAEELRVEGEKLNNRLQLGNRPLISLFIGDPEDTTVSDFINKLEGIVNAHPDAKFLISSSPRTKQRQFDDIASSLRGFVGDSSRIECFNFDTDDKENNPYKGAIAVSRNVIVVSQSHSMVSERLFTGQTVHVFYDEERYENSPNYGDYIDKGYVVNLRETDTDALVAEIFPSVDLTDIIAADLEQGFREHQKNHPDTTVEVKPPENLLKLEELERAAQQQKPLLESSAPRRFLSSLFPSLRL